MVDYPAAMRRVSLEEDMGAIERLQTRTLELLVMLPPLLDKVRPYDREKEWHDVANVTRELGENAFEISRRLARRQQAGWGK